MRGLLLHPAPAMGSLMMLLCLFCCFSTGYSVNLQNVRNFTSDGGSFCVTVSEPSNEPPGLNKTERKLWHSKPKMAIELWVKTHLHDEFDALATSVRINNTDIVVGNHDIDCEYLQEQSQVHSMNVQFDGSLLPPTIKETKYHVTDSSFTVIKVYAKGPLHYDWDNECPEVFTTPPESTAPPVDGVVVANNTTMLSAITSDSLESSTPETTLQLKKGTTMKIILWSVIGSILFAIIPIAVVTLIFYRRSRQQDINTIRNTNAEREKQKMIDNAKRLSYMEQMRWVESSVGTGGMSVTYEAAKETTTFKYPSNYK